MSPFGVGDDDMTKAKNKDKEEDKEFIKEIDEGLKKHLEEASEIKNLEDKLEDDTKKSNEILDSIKFESEEKSTSFSGEAKGSYNTEKLDKIGSIIKDRMGSREFVQAMNEIKKVLS